MSSRKPIPKETRVALWEKYNHRCAYCGQPIEYKDMQVDHIHSVGLDDLGKSYYGTDHAHDEYIYQGDINDLNNLLPACRQCNYYKDMYDIEEFRKRIKTQLIPNLVRTFNWRLAEKHGLVQHNDIPIVFYFEKLEKEKAQENPEP